MKEFLIQYPKTKWIAVAVVTILHIVGLIGIGVLKSENIQSLTWVNLTITFIIGLLFFESKFKNIVIALFIAAVIGMFSEAIGVNTGYLFGNYTYGSDLGIKIFQVPFTIGLLWAGLNVSAKNFASKFSKNPWLIAVLASIIMVVFDIVMEPAAMELNFWNWTHNTIPIFNYVCWFFVSLCIQLLWRNVDTRNSVFNSIFIIQFVFFISLNIIL